MGVRERLGKALVRVGRSFVKAAPRSPRAALNEGPLPGSEETELGGSVTNEQLYTKHVWVYACVFQSATRLAALPPLVYKANDDPEKEDEKVTGTWLNRLIEKPNDEGTWYDLIEGTVSYLELNGNAYWEVVDGDRAKGATPVKVYLLRSDRMEVKPHSERRVDYYSYAVTAGQEHRLEPDEVVHFRYFHPLNEQTGMGPSEPAAGALTIDFWSIVAQRDFFKHGARPEGVLQAPSTLSPEAYRRLSEMWKQKYKGIGKQMQTPILEEGMKYQKTQSTPDEAGMLDTRKSTREEVLAAYGVPPVIVGVLEHASYANAHEQTKEYWQGTLIPKLGKVYSTINAMVALFDPDGKLYVKPDLSSVRQYLPGFEQDQEERKTALEEVGAGARTINEYRKDVLGKEKVSWGDDWFIPATSGPASISMGIMEGVEGEGGTDVAGEGSEE